MESRGPLQYHRGSKLCGSYELRITRRCLTEDLDLEHNTEFSAALSHPIVNAFQKQRSTEPNGGKTVGPASGDRTIYRLGYGHDHRGATWFDVENRVVWLCAYGLHRSGEADDAFPYFQELIQAGRIRPTEDDYTVLFKDQGRRFAETVSLDAQALLTQARSNPGIEFVGRLGGNEPAAVVVEVVETLEETYVAFSIARMDPSRIILILIAFFPDSIFSDWELVPELPTRSLGSDELCYRILRG